MPIPVYVGGSYDQDMALQGDVDPGIAAAGLAPQPFVNQAPPPPMFPPQAIAQPPQASGTAAVPAQACPQPIQDDRPQVFIALKDSQVDLAVAYWIQEDTLHYLTPDGKHNFVSLDLVDRKMSARLNDRGLVPFVLPPLPGPKVSR